MAEFIENHFLGCSIVFVLSLFIIATAMVMTLALLNETVKTYLTHKRFLTTFLMTQQKETFKKLLLSLEHPEILPGDSITPQHFKHIYKEKKNAEETN